MWPECRRHHGVRLGCACECCARCRAALQDPMCIQCEFNIGHANSPEQGRSRESCTQRLGDRPHPASQLWAHVVGKICQSSRTAEGAPFAPFPAVGMDVSLAIPCPIFPSHGNLAIAPMRQKRNAGAKAGRLSLSN